MIKNPGLIGSDTDNQMGGLIKGIAYKGLGYSNQNYSLPSVVEENKQGSNYGRLIYEGNRPNLRKNLSPA